MKLLGLAFLVGIASAFYSADNCPHDKEVECITDVNHGKNMLQHRSPNM